MTNLKELPKEIQEIIISSYKIGTWDGSVDFKEPEDILDYLQANLQPIQEKPCNIELIDSVS